MNAYPVVGNNLTQTMFKQDEKLVVPSDSVSSAYQNLTALSGVNSMPQEIDNMHSQMPAFLNQAHLSTYYQDNPFGTLSYSTKYGVPVPGGNIDPTQPPGHKPGNTYSNYLKYSGQPNYPNYPSIVENTQKSGLMEGFANISSNEIVKIQWN
jgi:hypothetical protein